MKKVLIGIIVIVSCFTLVGCGSRKKSATINVSLNGIMHITSVKEGSTLEYSLIGEKYEFEVVNVTDEKIKIKVNKKGLASTDSLVSDERDFVIKRGSHLELHTQTTDYQESITFSF